MAKGRKAPAARKGQIDKVNDGAARARQVATFGNTARNGGGRVWTATNGRAAASKGACRGRVAW